MYEILDRSKLPPGSKIVVSPTRPTNVDFNKFSIKVGAIQTGTTNFKAFAILPIPTETHHIGNNHKPTKKELELRKKKRREFDRNPSHQRDKKKQESMKKHRR